MSTIFLRRAGAVVAGAAALALTLSACGGSDSGEGDAAATEQGGTLTIAYNLATESQDPISAVKTFYSFPAYDTLIHWAADGSLEPDLATEWGFTDETNTVFEIALREDVVFSDGTDMDADAVVNSMERFLEEAPNTTVAGPVEDIVVVDDHTIQIVYSEAIPESYVTNTLTQEQAFSMIISPAGLEDPDALATTTSGVGPYVYDAGQSTPGGAQVYVANDLYFNQDAVKYDQVVINPITSDATRLSSAITGENMIAFGIQLSSVSQAEDAGLQQSSQTNGAASNLILQNILEGPMSDIRVREAIAMAIPREELVDSIFNGLGYATSTNAVEGAPGYVEENLDLYTYDLEAAKELMAEAGYEGGFEMSIGVPSGADTNLAQALAVSFADIGITATLTNITVTSVAGADTTTYDAMLEPAVYPQMIYGTVSGALKSAFANPFGFSDDALDTAFAEITTVSGVDAQNEKLQAVTDTLDHLAWRLPISVQPTISVVAAGVENVPETVSGGITLDPFSPNEEDAWYGTP